MLFRYSLNTLKNAYKSTMYENGEKIAAVFTNEKNKVCIYNNLGIIHYIFLYL